MTARTTTIATAAIALPSGLILSEPRPADHMCVHLSADAAGVTREGREEGFLTSRGEFVHPKTALEIAQRSGQFLRQGSWLALTCEDLWGSKHR